MPLQPLVRLAQLAAALVFLAAASLAPAHDGEDHGAAPAVTHAIAPRFAARSAAFDVVGIVQGGQLALYIDRAADNAPLTKGSIEIEGEGVQLRLEAGPDAVFRAPAGILANPGRHALTLTIEGGDTTDLLTAQLDSTPDSAPLPADAAAGSWPLAYLALPLLALAAFFFKRQHTRRKENP